MERSLLGFFIGLFLGSASKDWIAKDIGLDVFNNNPSVDHDS